MATTALDRLLFAQGGDCFFCHEKLPREEASVEHLVASTLGGSDSDENCVACCKTLNRLFGRMSLKEKMQLLLKQRGDFQCPGKASVKATSPTAPKTATAATPKKSPPDLSTLEGQLQLAADDLRKRGNSRPGNEEKLLNTVRSALAHKSVDPDLATKVLNVLKERGWVMVNEGKCSYQLPPRESTL